MRTLTTFGVLHCFSATLTVSGGQPLGWAGHQGQVAAERVLESAGLPALPEEQLLGISYQGIFRDITGYCRTYRPVFKVEDG